MIDSYSTANGGDTSGVGAGSQAVVDTAAAQPVQPMVDPFDPYIYRPEDQQSVVGDIMTKYGAWRNMRRPLEVKWYLNTATVTGLSSIRWNDYLGQFENERQPMYKQRGGSNMILPRFRARKAKFLKQRYMPVVVPASGDKDDKLNANASQKGLEYIARKCRLEQVYKEAVDYALLCGKGFVWLYWDSSAVRTVKDPLTGEVIKNRQVGDITIAAGSPFEMLVPNLGLSNIGDQPEFIRVRTEELGEFKLRHQAFKGVNELKADASAADAFMYQRQIANLSSRTNQDLAGASASMQSSKELDYITVIEHFKRPCSKYPRGRYVLVAGNTIVRYADELPYGFADDPVNPYPVVEFADLALAGQFWPTTIVEQLIPTQREYHMLRAKLQNHVSKMVHPKIIVSAHCKFPEKAWTDEAGEVIRVLTPPGIMEPKVITPPPISQDVWNSLNLMKEEFDMIPTLFPASQGMAGDTNSGFQVNLLQEATDSVHAPDIRSHELEYEELYKKIRKMMALGYDIPRLISVTGRNFIPDVIELSSASIDQDAEIVVMANGTLSNSPSLRTQQVLELWSAGMFADETNPAEGRRKALTLLDTNGLGEFQEEKRRDEEKARLENLSVQRGQPIPPPLPFDDHVVQYQVHVDQTKTADFAMWPQQQQQQLFIHIIQHMKYINPQQALNTLMELGLGHLGPSILPQMFAAPAAPAAPANQPPSGGVPPQGQQVSAGQQA